MPALPFAPTTLTGILADLAFLVVIIGGPLVLKWWSTHQKGIAKWYMSQTTAQERAVLSSLAHDAVAWAERFASSPAGEQKMKQAIAFVQAALKTRGITLDVQEIIGAIQSAVAAAKVAGVLAAAGPTLAVQPTPAPIIPPRPTPPAPAPAPKPATVPVAPGGPSVNVPVTVAQA